MNWFSQLPPGEQITIVVLVITSIFNAGVFYATIRFLRKDLREVKITVKEHADKLEEHAKDIAALQAVKAVSAKAHRGL